MNYVLLSKEISYALRHAPWAYELILDETGSVDINMLIDSLHKFSEWHDVTREHIEQMVRFADKPRHEIEGDRIRALYGHTISEKIVKPPKTPPNILYHGTSHSVVDSIMKLGLLPMQRQYVHLSTDIEQATRVGRRKDKAPCILLIHTDIALQIGIIFYQGNDRIWLADRIPSECIEVMSA